MDFSFARWFNKLWGRVTLIFLLCLLPMIGVQLFSQQRSTTIVRRYIHNTSAANTVYLNHQFSENIEMVGNILQYTIGTECVRKFFVYNQRYNRLEYYDAVQSVLNQLVNVRNSNPYIQEARLYFPRNGVMLQSSKARTGIFSVQKQDILEKLRAYGEQNSLIVEKDGAYLMYSTSGVFSLESESAEHLPAIFLEVVLNKSEMAQHLSSFSAEKEILSFQYRHATGSVLLSGQTDLEGELNAVLGTICASHSEEPNIQSATIGNTEYNVISSYSSMLNATFGQLIPAWELEVIPNSVRESLLSFSVLSAVILILLAAMVYRQVSRPTQALLDAFEATGSGKFGNRLAEGKNHYTDEYRVLFRRFNDMNRRIEALIEENYESALNLQRAQFKQLQAQINPHFLYNSFFLLRDVLAEGDLRQAEDFAQCLGDYFQYISRNDSETATLGEEYRHARNYLTIQALRFEDRLELDIPPLPAEWENIVVPKLILQPLVENVMVHGKWNSADVRRIRLSYEETKTDYGLHIEDNGLFVTDESIQAVREMLCQHISPQNSSGLLNIHRRMRLKYNAGGLRVAHSALGGFMVSMRIPKSAKGSMQ